MSAGLPAEAASVSCEHHYASIHQPGMPVYWIRQCLTCRAFDAEDLAEQVRQLTEAAVAAAVAAERERILTLLSDEIRHPRTLSGDSVYQLGKLADDLAGLIGEPS